MYKQMLDEFLHKVEKPGRYTGGELNCEIKNTQEAEVRFAFCFPDVYEVGMSHLGMRILYHLLNAREDTFCERVFAPWPDMEKEMRERNILLYGLESKEPISKSDFIGFTLQYEMSYTNILNMLSLAGVSLFSKDRKEDEPFVCAGGPCAYNGEPIADFIDFFMLGEGEEIIGEVMDEYKAFKKEGGKRKDFLRRIAKIEGIYVPSFYDVSYNPDGTVFKITPNEDVASKTVKKRIIKDFDNCYVPEKIIVPYLDIVHDRIMLELFRGCIRGCRFCQAGMIYRPVRERSPKFLEKLARALIKSSGYEEMSLSSLSTSDYSHLSELLERISGFCREKHVNLALPSLRIDSFSVELMEKISGERKGSLTFAPEAGTQRMRDIINKNVTEADLKESVTAAFSGGYSGVKLYFMIGLPFEENADVCGIAELAHKVLDAYFAVPKEKRNKQIGITVSTSSFVPKPFTPFQWVGQNTKAQLVEKQRLIKENIKSRKISYNYHESDVSYLEAVFARGDRRLSKVLYAAFEKGCKFDGWSEFFDFNAYMDAFEQCGINPDFYALRERGENEVFPWEHIDVGVTREFLLKEYKKAEKGETTKSCRESCSSCGAASFGGGVCFEKR